jgi:hypothetical protein
VEELVLERDFLIVPKDHLPPYARNASTIHRIQRASVWLRARYTFKHLLLLDYRTFVNIPNMVHVLLPQFPRPRLYLGSMLDIGYFGWNTSPRGQFLSRARIPFFAHGMAVVLSADLVAVLANFRASLRTDVPFDIGLGLVLQPVEDLEYAAVYKYFHGHPGDLSHPDPDIARFAHECRGASSIAVFNMTLPRWRALPEKCDLCEP